MWQFVNLIKNLIKIKICEKLFLMDLKITYIIVYFNNLIKITGVNLSFYQLCSNGL